MEGSDLGAKKVMERLDLPHKFYVKWDKIADVNLALKGCKGKPYSSVCKDMAGQIRTLKGK